MLLSCESSNKCSQKPKLKVGKAKAKPENFTDTSFRAKGMHGDLLLWSKRKIIDTSKQSLLTNNPSTSPRQPPTANSHISSPSSPPNPTPSAVTLSPT
jgi:pre-rRNA-processing protein IPI1